jgi:hypothetical protein
VGPQVQRVQVTDSRAACEALRTMMAQTMTQTAAQVEQAVKAQSPGNSLWTQTTLVCQEER